MHLYDAVLTTSSEGQVLLGAGIVLAAAGTAVGLRKLDYEQVPRAAVLSAVFFVVSLLAHVPLGPTEFHLVLNGLIGIVLGWAAFPALLIALLLQAALFQTGGLLAVGLNTVVMASPAVVCYYLFGPAVRGRHNGLALAAGVAAGTTGVLLAGLLNAASLAAVGQAWEVLSAGVLLAHVMLAAVEGVVTAAVVVFLRKVSPELLGVPRLLSVGVEARHV